MKLNTTPAPQSQSPRRAPWRENLDAAQRHLERWVPAPKTPTRPEPKTPAGQCFRRVNEILNRVPVPGARAK